jgi:predicted dehydrogenase
VADSVADRYPVSRSARPRPLFRAPSLSSTALHIAVVGYGYWGSKHVRVLTSMPRVTVTVVEPDPDRRAAACEQYPSAGIAADLEHVLGSVDAVLIATPPATHAAMSLTALAAGKPVLVEKPMATSVADAAAMVRTAAERGVTLMVGHTFMYNAAVRKLKQIIDSGDLGRILYVDSARLGLGRYQSDCNVIWDLAPHDISILAYLLDEFPRKVSVWAHRNVGASHADVAYIRLGFEESQTNAFVRVSWLDPFRARRATVVGDRQMVVYDDTSDTDRLRVYDIGADLGGSDDRDHAFPVSFRRGDILSPYIDFTEPLLVQDSHFVECVRSGAAPITPGGFGLAVVQVLAAADRARRNGNTALIPADPTELPALPGPVNLPGLEVVS